MFKKKDYEIVLTHKEAAELLYKTKWKTSLCSAGKECWCRIIVPIKPIYWKDKNTQVTQEIYIAGSGSIDKKSAEYIIKLHNNSLKEGIK